MFAHNIFPVYLFFIFFHFFFFCLRIVCSSLLDCEISTGVRTRSQISRNMWRRRRPSGIVAIGFLCTIRYDEMRFQRSTRAYTRDKYRWIKKKNFFFIKYRACLWRVRGWCYDVFVVELCTVCITVDRTGPVNFDDYDQPWTGRLSLK